MDVERTPGSAISATWTQPFKASPAATLASPVQITSTSTTAEEALRRPGAGRPARPARIPPRTQASSGPSTPRSTTSSLAGHEQRDARDVQDEERRGERRPELARAARPRASSQSTSGGPLMLIEVVSTPLRKPGRRPPGCGHGRPVAELPAARPRPPPPPRPTWSASFESAASSSTPSGRPGQRGHEQPARGRRWPPGGPRPGRGRRAPRRAGAAPSPPPPAPCTANSAGERTSAKPKPVADCTAAPANAASRGERHQPTVTSSFGKPVRISGSPSGHDHEVLDPDADSPGHVDARLDRDRVARGERALGGLAEPRRLVHLEPDAVAEPVAEVLLVAGAVDDLARDRVHRPALGSRLGARRAHSACARSTSS